MGQALRADLRPPRRRLEGGRSSRPAGCHPWLPRAVEEPDHGNAGAGTGSRRAPCAEAANLPDLAEFRFDILDDDDDEIIDLE